MYRQFVSREQALDIITRSCSPQRVIVKLKGFELIDQSSSSFWVRYEIFIVPISHRDHAPQYETRDHLPWADANEKLTGLLGPIEKAVKEKNGVLEIRNQELYPVEQTHRL